MRFQERASGVIIVFTFSNERSSEQMGRPEIGRTMISPKEDEQNGWLPDKDYSLSEAMILSIVLLSLAILIGQGS